MPLALVNDEIFKIVKKAITSDFNKFLKDLGEINFEINETTATETFNGFPLNTILYDETTGYRVFINRVSLDVTITHPKGLNRKQKRALKTCRKAWTPRETILNLAKSVEGFEEWFSSYGFGKPEDIKLYTEEVWVKPKKGDLSYFLDVDVK